MDKEKNNEMKKLSVNYLKKSRADLTRAMMYLGQVKGEYPTEVINCCHILSDMTQIRERIDLIIRANDTNTNRKNG